MKISLCRFEVSKLSLAIWMTVGALVAAVNGAQIARADTAALCAPLRQKVEKWAKYQHAENNRLWVNSRPLKDKIQYAADRLKTGAVASFIESLDASVLADLDQKKISTEFFLDHYLLKTVLPAFNAGPGLASPTFCLRDLTSPELGYHGEMFKGGVSTCTVTATFVKNARLDESFIEFKIADQLVQNLSYDDRAHKDMLMPIKYLDRSDRKFETSITVELPLRSLSQQHKKQDLAALPTYIGIDWPYEIAESFEAFLRYRMDLQKPISVTPYEEFIRFPYVRITTLNSKRRNILCTDKIWGGNPPWGCFQYGGQYWEKSLKYSLKAFFPMFDDHLSPTIHMTTEEIIDLYVPVECRSK